jgi:chromosome segregation and condensation protein ScpB
MLTADYVAQRELKLEERSVDLVVTGGAYRVYARPSQRRAPG